MWLFGQSKVVAPDVLHRLAQLELELGKTQSELRQVEGEQALMHDQVRKWMRRAIAAERTALRVSGSEGNPGPRGASPEVPGASRGGSLRGWGARGRIAQREQLEEGADNGVHP